MGSGGAESAVMSTMDLKNHGHSDVTKQATTQLVKILAVEKSYLLSNTSTYFSYITLLS